MGKSKHKISNWKQYNQALVQRGSLTVWMDEQAIQQWHCQTHHGRRGRGFHYSDSAIETALMLKAVFKLPLRALEGFINSLFQLMNVPLQSPDYSCISKRAKTVEIKYRLPSHGPVAHLVIDATGLKVYGEGEWKIRKHGKEKRRVWRKLHLAVDAATHAIVAAEVSLETVGDNEVLPTLLNPLRRKIEQVSADGAYDTRACYALLQKKGIKATEPESRIAAIVDLTFNLGAGRLQTSTLRRRINQRDWSAAATELRRWVYGGGKVLPGLFARREAEISLLDTKV